jgi:hypothetical protein
LQMPQPAHSAELTICSRVRGCRIIPVDLQAWRWRAASRLERQHL